MNQIKEIQAKSILTPSNLPGADFVINPYVGCLFGCQYCYASFIGRFKHPGQEWGTFCDIKINAAEILRRDLEKLAKKTGYKDFGLIFFSSVTDPYLGLEAKYKITRSCLQTLVDFDYQGVIGIQSKSPLITRDIDLFKKLNAEVGLTITSTDDKISRFLETGAPPVSARFEALKKLNHAGVKTYAFVGPLLPHFASSEQLLTDLFRQIRQTGTKSVWLEHINLSPKIRARLFSYLEQKQPELIPIFQQTLNREYRHQLEHQINQALKATKLEVLGGGVIYHQSKKD